MHLQARKETLACSNNKKKHNTTVIHCCCWQGLQGALASSLHGYGLWTWIRNVAIWRFDHFGAGFRSSEYSECVDDTRTFVDTPELISVLPGEADFSWLSVSDLVTHCLSVLEAVSHCLSFCLSVSLSLSVCVTGKAAVSSVWGCHSALIDISKANGELKPHHL